jgi:hypothetical protein
VGRRLAASLGLALLLVPAAVAADVYTSARYVRMAIPAMEAYAADHGSYKGATLAKLRRYDRSLRHIVLRTVKRRTYCVESTTRPFAHKAGPGAPVSTGRCGQHGTEIGYGPTPPSTSPPPATAEQRIRETIPALEAYAADHNGYAGVTVAALRTYDATIADVTIVHASRTTYCVESGAGTEQRHKDGPGAAIAAGPCPATRTLTSARKAPGEGQLRPKAADMRFARKAQLTPHDFPFGTRRDPERRADVFLLPRCPGFYEPDRTDLVATGVAQAFFRTPYSSYYGSSVTVWRNHTDADAYWQRVFTPRYRDCLERNLPGWHKPGVRVRVIYAKQVPARYSIGERRAAYEIAIRYTTRTTSLIYVRAAFMFQNDRAIGVAMASGVRDACGCTATLAGRVYSRMRPTPGG